MAVAIKRKTICCSRCEKNFPAGAQVVLIKCARTVFVVHPYRRCYSYYEDLFVAQGLVTKDKLSVKELDGNEPFLFTPGASK